MYTSINKRKVNKGQSDGNVLGQKLSPKIISWFMELKAQDSSVENLLRSQIILFNSRKKWGLLFALATLSGLFCIPLSSELFPNSYLTSGNKDVLTLGVFLLPISTLLVITGMYVFNDLIDADLDRANGKTKRPIPSGKIPKNHAVIFIIVINIVGITIPALTGNFVGLFFISIIALIGVLYSLPKVSLKDKFVIKTLAIAIAMMCSLLLGSSMYLDSVFRTGSGSILVPTFSGVIVALMVFVTSPLNDIGDINGDKAAGRRTIPIVIGKEQTVWASLATASVMAIISWSIYAVEILSTPNSEINIYSLSNSKLVFPLAISFISIITIIHLLSTMKEIDNQNFLRNSVIKKSMPLHILLQFSLAIGCLLF